MEVLAETSVAVSEDPAVELFVAQSRGPSERGLLVIHGGPDWDHTYLREPLCSIGDKYRLIMPDIRGCGRSTGMLAPEQYTPDAVIGDLRALLDALGLDRVDVLGFSYGGLLAQRFALAAPARVGRLIIASSSVDPVPPDAFDDWPQRAERQSAEAALWDAGSMSGVDLVREAAFAGARANVWRDDRLAAYRRVLAQVRFTAEWLGPWQSGNLPSARPAEAAARLAGLGLPILLLHGAQDMTFPADLAFKAAAAIPTATAVVLPDAGHMAHIDQPDRWIEAVETFLTSRQRPA